MTLGNLASELSSLDADVSRALDEIAVPAYLVDRDRRIRGLNRAALAISGDVRGKFVESLVAPADRAGTQARTAKLLLDGVPPGDVTVSLLGPAGRPIRVEASSVALRDSAHTIVGIFGLLRPTLGAPHDQAAFALTPRQHEVLRALRAGQSTAQMAELMGIAPETVRNHVRRLLAALGVHSRLEAVALAQREHLDDD
jgi:DNA-binding CsgD family transcriptional regulator